MYYPIAVYSLSKNRHSAFNNYVFPLQQMQTSDRSVSCYRSWYVNATPAVHVSCYYGAPLILKHETGMCVGGDDNSYVSLF